MVNEVDPGNDFGPVESGALTVYPVSSSDGSPVTSMLVVRVSAEHPRDDFGVREYDVEVEFKSDDYGLEDVSLEEYLGSFRHARVTQEAMVKKIHEDLKNALETEDVFVEVHRKAPADKRTQAGGIAKR